LRIRLRLDPRNPDLIHLCSLPWELLHSSGSGFLALDPLTPVVRSLDLPAPATLPPFKRPLRILAVVSHPKGLRPLDLDLEKQRIQEIWRVQDEVEVTFLPRATLNELRTAVRNTEYHIFHFMGHGAFDRLTGEGLLLFEDHSGEAQGVSGRLIIPALRGFGFPRLAFLNACQTADTAPNGSDPLAGVAVSLLSGGLPAVLAMQSPIPDEAAIRFAGAVYQSLSCGEPLEQAVTEGRLTLHSELPGTLNWAIPALFLRTSDGALFEGQRISVYPEESPTPSAEKTLRTLQKDLYSLLDSIRLRTIDDYRRLNAQERLAVETEVVQRMAGLGGHPGSLLDFDHVNARFAATPLLEDSKIVQGLDELHRKAAIYSDHSIVWLPNTWDIQDGVTSMRLPDNWPDESTILLLLQHRPLIETGRMSIVPRQVYQQAGIRKRRIFSVEDLDTVEVNLRDKWARRSFSTEGRAFDSAGIIVFETPSGGRLPLAEVLEVEERYGKEYEHFQTHFREIFDRLSPEERDNDTKTLQRALKEVDEGIQALEAAYDKILRRQKEVACGIPSGALAIVVYDLGAAAESFLTDAFAGSALSPCVRFIPKLDAIPNEIRSSAFFIPWLLLRKGA
jgi:hypothetical protein